MIQRFDAFVSGITACYKYIQRIKSMEMTEFGLKGTHVMCLYYLRRNPAGLTAAQLCGLCAEDKAAISRTVSELRSRGYITSLSKKAYRAMLTLTAAGQELARKFDQLIEDWVTAGGDGLTDEERCDFYKALSSIAENLRSRIEAEAHHT
ncbi:MAG: winged helix-turn-helix transcriptional regulator [Oscillospiraceae bacterium]|nr:winged helix-turn-helix transcriptional regulator [Oscillospiraceae bacterium]